MTLSADVDLILHGIGVQRDRYRRGERVVRSPLTGETIAQVEDANSVRSYDGGMRRHWWTH